MTTLQIPTISEKAHQLLSALALEKKMLANVEGTWRAIPTPRFKYDDSMTQITERDRIKELIDAGFVEPLTDDKETYKITELGQQARIKHELDNLPARKSTAAHAES